MSGPIPRCPSKGPCWSRSSRMLDLLPYFNEDAPSRTYGDGNTAMAQGKAAMYLQGPWALVEIEKAGTDVELGSFPLPVTDDPADRRIRVNIDLSLWIPEQANEQDGARELLQHLMIPDIQFPYNELALAFSTTDDAPEVSDPRISEMQPYYDEGKFYMGASQFIPTTIPFGNYIQSIVLGADPEPILAQIDSDFARLAYRACTAHPPSTSRTPYVSDDIHRSAYPARRGTRPSPSLPCPHRDPPPAEGGPGLLRLPLPRTGDLHPRDHLAGGHRILLQLHQLGGIRGLGFHRLAQLHRPFPGPKHPGRVRVHARLRPGHRHRGQRDRLRARTGPHLTDPFPDSAAHDLRDPHGDLRDHHRVRLQVPAVHFCAGRGTEPGGWVPLVVVPGQRGPRRAGHRDRPRVGDAPRRDAHLYRGARDHPGRAV